MRENTADDQRSVQIRRILCNKEQPVQKVSEQQKKNNRAEQPQLLADNGKIMSFCASGILVSFWVLFPRPLPKNPPKTNGIQSLQYLIASGILMILRMQPGQHPV